MVRLIACSIAVLWASLWATSLSAQTARERASESYRGMRVRDVRLALGASAINCGYAASGI